MYNKFIIFIIISRYNVIISNNQFNINFIIFNKINI